MIHPPHLQLRLARYLELSNEERFALDCEIQQELNRQMRVYGAVRSDLYPRVVPHMDDEMARRFCKRPFLSALSVHIKRKLVQLTAVQPRKRNLNGLLPPPPEGL